MKEQIMLKDFLRYRFLSNIQYSPDGRYAAYGVASSDWEANSYKSFLYLWDGQSHRRLTGFGDERIFAWENASSLLFASLREDSDKKAVKSGEERTVFYRLSLHGGEAERAFSVPLTATGIIPVGRNKYILTVSLDLRFSRLYLADGEEKANLLAKKQEEKDYQVLDEFPFYINGRGYTNKLRSALFLYEEDQDLLTPISGFETEVEMAKWDPAHSLLYYMGESYETKRTFRQSIWAYSPETGQSVQLLSPGAYSIYAIEPWGTDLLVWATDEKRYGCNENPWFYLLKDGRLELLAPWDDAPNSTVGSDCRLGSGKSFCACQDTFYFLTTRMNSSHIYGLKKDGSLRPIAEYEGSVDFMDVWDNTLLYCGMQEGRLQELYTLNLDTDKRCRISQHNEWVIQTKDVRPLRPCSFVQEGIQLYGWVMPPRDYQEGKKYPAILDIHGGPKTVYGEVFYHEMQVWANLGYFVFFMNPRGADGRGNDFADLRGKYGTIDYEDLMEFTSLVLERYPDIDANRLGVTGGSYGGFMTNWIIGHTDRFRAAASQRSIANWVSMAHTSDIGEMFVRDQMAADTWTDPAKLWQHSPLKYAKEAVTPTLFIHSDEDFRCPLSEGFQMYSALMENGIEARMCIFKGENHELSRGGRPRQRVRRLEEITNWMESHLKEN